MDSSYFTVSNAAFAGMFVAIGLVAFGKISFKQFIFIAGGLAAVGFATKPDDVTT